MDKSLPTSADLSDDETDMKESEESDDDEDEIEAADDMLLHVLLLENSCKR